MGGPVDDDMANLIVAQLLYLDSVDQERDITMYVNSPGGSVTAGERGDSRQEEQAGRGAQSATISSRHKRRGRGSVMQ